jgi:hypothetical protein
MTMKRTRATVVGAALTAAVALGAAAAAVVYVNAERLDVVDKKRSVAKTVVTVDRNAPLNVIAKEGNWYKVETGGKQGYVFANAVSDKPGQGGKNAGVSLSAVNGGPVPKLESAAAVKGLNANAQKYASTNGLNTSGLREVQRRREAISGDEFERFLRQGKLGVARGEGQPHDAAQANAE